MKRERPFQAWVQISVGCNCVCSYCIVPSTRGREQSRSPADIVREVEALAADGVMEVTLLGQNVNSYGRDLPKDERIDFADLLALVDGVEGIERIRYTSPHPKDMREQVIVAHAELPSLCEHIHLPLQSGSSRILKAMRRTYDRDRYMERVEMIREHVPDCAITTDIIVGFPGETEEDFRATLEVVEEVGYDSAFTFVFSPRRGTEAATLPDQLPHAVKRERMERLVELVQRRALERCERFVGTTQEVLVEGPSRTDPAQAARAAPATTRPSTSRGSPSRASWSRSRSPGRPRRRWRARSPWSHASLDRHLRPHGRRQDRDRGRARRAAARARGGPVAVSADAIAVYEGLDVLAAKPATEPARAPAGVMSCRSRRSSARGGSRSWRMPRSTGCWPRAGRRSWSGAPGSTCAPR